MNKLDKVTNKNGMFSFSKEKLVISFRMPMATAKKPRL